MAFARTTAPEDSFPRRADPPLCRCDLAGIAVPTLMDGRSLVPLLSGSRMGLTQRPWRTHFMIEFAEGGFQQW